MLVDVDIESFFLQVVSRNGEVNGVITYLAGPLDAKQPGVLRHSDKGSRNGGVCEITKESKSS